METDLIDMIAKNDSPSDVHAKIKDVLYAKSAENIDQIRPSVTSSLFGGPEITQEPEVETEVPAPEGEVEVEVGDEVAAPEAEAEVETPTAEVEVEPEKEEEKPEA